jgi:hypothetical protein
VRLTVEGIRVSEDGEVIVPSSEARDVEYHWAGERVAVVTRGPGSSEHLVEDSDVPTPALVALVGVLDARVFADEFPRQKLSGDWDAEAWAISAHENVLACRDTSESWDVYRRALGTAVNLLAHGEQS